MGGYSWMKDSSDGFGASNSEFPTDAYLYNKLEAGRLAELIETGEGENKTTTLKTYGGVSSWKNESLLIGFFGRFTYNYDNRFNLLATLRYEGSSKFGAGHKWGLFPAVSAGWTISNEDWLKDAGWIENLKLRAGYGKTGVIPGSSYMSLLLYDYDTQYGNYITPDGVWRPSLTPTQNANPDLKWENTQEVNVGLDFGFFHGRLFGSLDGYYKLTTDLLWDYSVPVPPNLYGSTTANVGSMSNYGVELMLGVVPVRTRNFEWSTTLTAAHNKNKLVSLFNELYETEDYIDGAWTEEPTSMCVQRTYIGGSLGDFYMLKSTGLGTARSNKGLWMIENPATGESDMFVDGMRSYDSSYRQYLGSGLPKVTLGWSNNFRLFNFDLVLAFSSQLGHKIFNCQRMFYENLNIGLNRYKSAVLPVYGGVLSPSQQPVAVSYYLERGDYLKLDNLNLGYTFNTSKAKYLEKARIYFSGENVFTLTAYKGIDPEMSTSDRFGFGVDYRNKYPTIRTWTIGVNITFGGGKAKDRTATEVIPAFVDRRPAEPDPQALERARKEGERIAAEKFAAEKAAIEKAAAEKLAAQKAACDEALSKAAQKNVSSAKGLQMNHVDTFFTLNSSVISSEEAAKLNEYAEWLKEHPALKVLVTGYADRNTGTHEQNEELSMARAKAVRDYLVKQGVEVSRIYMEAKGDSVQPFAEAEMNRVAISTLK